MSDLTHPEDDLLAAEYVVGTLALQDRIAFENRLKTEAPLDRSVAAWEAHFAPLNDAYGEVAPPAAIFARIESRLFPKAPAKSWFSGWLAAGSSAVAVALVAIFYLTAAPDPTLQATLAANESEVSYLVQVSDAGISLTRQGPAPLDTQSHELWLIVGDAAPVSLGLIGDTPLPLPETLAPGMILAVSQEPLGGSTTGAPTGPVLALGPLESI